jgi:hypothetical protein
MITRQQFVNKLELPEIASSENDFLRVWLKGDTDASILDGVKIVQKK